MAATDVNARWQADMAGFFENFADAPDEGFLQLAEIFNLEDKLSAVNASAGNAQGTAPGLPDS